MNILLTKKWNPKYDIRTAIQEKSCVDRSTVDKVVDALFDCVYSNVKSVIVGVAKFEWKPINTRLPDGSPVETRRLVVTPSRYCTIPAKDIPVLGKSEVQMIKKGALIYDE